MNINRVFLYNKNKCISHIYKQRIKRNKKFYSSEIFESFTELEDFPNWVDRAYSYIIEFFLELEVPIRKLDGLRFYANDAKKNYNLLREKCLKYLNDFNS